MTTGVELSYTRVSQDGAWGILSSVDWSSGLFKAHVGIQASRGVGLSVGPTLTTAGDNVDYGFTATPFAGFVLYPFYAYTWRAHSPDIQEAGLFVKIPFRVSGEPIRFGN